MYRALSFSHLGTAVFLGVWLATQLASPAMAADWVRAKVGILVRSGARTAAAKTTETVTVGDFLRVYVVPEDDAYIYVVHNDGARLTLLNAQDAATMAHQGLLVALPTPEKFYQIDGSSNKESITIICSPTAIPEVTTLFSTMQVSQEGWTSLQKKLLEKSKIPLAHDPEKPFQIGGNVRSLVNDPFLDTLQISSGKTLVVKKYEFQVQK